MAQVVGIDSGQGEQVRTGVDGPGDSGTCSLVMLIYHVADRGVPAAIWVTKEFDWLAHVFFDLDFALGYFQFSHERRQSSEDRVVDAMGPKLEPLARQLPDILPIKQRLLGDPIRLARPVICSPAVSRRQENGSRESPTVQEGCRRCVEILKAIVKGKRYSPFREWPVARQRGNDLTERHDSCIVAQPFHLCCEELGRNL